MTHKPNPILADASPCDLGLLSMHMADGKLCLCAPTDESGVAFDFDNGGRLAILWLARSDIARGFYCTLSPETCRAFAAALLKLADECTDAAGTEH